MSEPGVREHRTHDARTKNTGSRASRNVEEDVALLAHIDCRVSHLTLVCFFSLFGVFAFSLRSSSIAHADECVGRL